MLKVGTVIHLRKEDAKVDEYKSKVVDVGEGFVMVDYPIHIETGKTIFLIDGTELFATFSDELKMSYRFRTEVQGRHMAEIPMLQLSYQEESLLKIQRREFVRVGVNVDVAVSVEEGATVLRLITADISAGGLAINLPEVDMLQEDTAVSLLIVLPFLRRPIQYVRAEARVIRIFERDQRHIATLAFTSIADEDRQQVIQFCFERQLQMKKKMK